MIRKYHPPYGSVQADIETCDRLERLKIRFRERSVATLLRQLGKKLEDMSDEEVARFFPELSGNSGDSGE